MVGELGPHFLPALQGVPSPHAAMGSVTAHSPVPRLGVERASLVGASESCTAQASWPPCPALSVAPPVLTLAGCPTWSYLVTTPTSYLVSGPTCPHLVTTPACSHLVTSPTWSHLVTSPTWSHLVDSSTCSHLVTVPPGLTLSLLPPVLTWSLAHLSPCHYSHLFTPCHQPHLFSPGQAAPWLKALPVAAGVCGCFLLSPICCRFEPKSSSGGCDGYVGACCGRPGARDSRRGPGSGQIAGTSRGREGVVQSVAPQPSFGLQAGL